MENSQGKCGVCSHDVEKWAFSSNCKCDNCELVFHTQCAKIHSIYNCVRCEKPLPIPGSSKVPHPASSKVPVPVSSKVPIHGTTRIAKAKSDRSNHSSTSSRKSKVVLNLEHLRKEEELFLQQQREKERLLEEKHKTQESFLKRKMELEQELNDLSEDDNSINQPNEDDHFNEVEKSIKKVNEWQNSQKAGTVYLSAGPSLSESGDISNRNAWRKARQHSITAPESYHPEDSWKARQVIKLDLPCFDGNPAEWPAFLSTFHSTTSLCNIGNAENIRRLDKALKGSARKAVSGLLLFPDKVETIMDRLKLLFGRDEFIINSQIEKLISEQPQISIDSIESLIEYATNVENIASQMVHGQMVKQLWNQSLLQIIIDKLPSTIKLEWAEFRARYNAVNIEIFSAWLFEKAMNASSLLTKPVKFESPKKRNKNSINVHSEMSKCPCDIDCKELSSCPKFRAMNRSQRWDVINSTPKRCQQCLKLHNGKCFSNKTCGVNNCQFKHHPLLHKFESDQIGMDLPNVNHHNSRNATTLFKIVPIMVHANSRAVSTFAMLDDGSSLTLMDEELAQSLKVSGTQEPLCLKWTDDTTRIEEGSKRISIQISSMKSEKRYTLNDVRTISSLDLPIQTVDATELKRMFSRNEDIECPSYKNAKPRILIGLDNPRLLVNTKAHFSTSGSLVAAKTQLGWTVFGANNKDINSVFHICECQTLTKALHDFISQENLIISSENGTLLSDADIRANKIMENSIKYVEGHYEMPLLWKYDSFRLPSSYNMAMNRLKCLSAKLKKDPELKVKMDKLILEYLDKGYARILTKHEIESTSHEQNWYLPVFVVKNPNKPSKIRIVWDAAARVGKVSLNDLLLKGPDLLANLPGVLFRFRQWAVAVTGDIREMFHQVRVCKDDQRFQRFLWFMEDVSEPVTLEMQVMSFGATCSPSCAQFVKNFNASKFKKEYPRAVESILKNHYVDDLLESVPTEDEAISLAKDVKRIHLFAGFEIRNWRSNSEAVLNELEQIHLFDEMDLNLNEELQLEKVLGMFWNIKKDCFTYSLKFNKSNKDILNCKKRPTKREMLRLVMSIFDPLGLLSHILIYPRILLQMLWSKKMQWDEEIDDDVNEKWMRWVKNLPVLEKIEIPRHYNLTRKTGKPDIHIFVDASERAYGAVAYLRCEIDGKVFCSIIAAKSRVAPLKPLTIPRLELLAALIGARLEKHIRTEHSISFHKSFFWSDSKTVLSWIHSDMRNFKPYVSCRIGEILESTNSNQWRWISTDSNVADVATRLDGFDAKLCTIWFQGPSFLSLNESEWPNNITIEDTTEECHISTKYGNVFHINVVDPSRFSNWNRIIRTEAWVLRFIHNLKSNKFDRIFDKLLSKKEIYQAEQWVLKQAQSEIYGEEICYLQKGEKVLNKKSPLYKKLPFLDENGLLRSRGRLDKLISADVDLKNPIILPRFHSITRLIIMNYHNRFHHHNHETIVNELRQKFYIPKLRMAYKEVRKSCQMCKIKEARASEPQMSDLPISRMKPFTQPFTYTGIDFFGPILVSVNRRNVKRWGVIFTCLNIRAVHIEISHSLSTDSCILVLRNFMNRRCIPAEIYSDNGTNLRGASKELKEQISKIDQTKLAENFISSNTAWYFNPPACPHMGGAWERLVRSIKTTLAHICIPKTPTDEVLNSTMIEIENIVNSRPLTYLPIEDCESEALTPNHFLKGSSNGIRNLGECNIDKDVWVKNWKRSQQLANLFWKRWVTEYLPCLNRRTKWFEAGRQIKVGDIVQILDETKERNNWQKGLVLQVYTSRDGKVRKAEVKTNTGIYIRPAVKLAILDVRKVDALELEDPTNATGAGVINHPNTEANEEPNEV